MNQDKRDKPKESILQKRLRENDEKRKTVTKLKEQGVCVGRKNGCLCIWCFEDAMLPGGGRRH